MRLIFTIFTVIALVASVAKCIAEGIPWPYWESWWLPLMAVATAVIALAWRPERSGK